MRVSLSIFFLCFSVSALATCHKHQEKLHTYNKKLKSLKNRHCFFPKTGERKPCLNTGIAEEMKVRKLASIALMSACESKK